MAEKVTLFQPLRVSILYTPLTSIDTAHAFSFVKTDMYINGSLVMESVTTPVSCPKAFGTIIVSKNSIISLRIYSSYLM